MAAHRALLSGLLAVLASIGASEADAPPPIPPVVSAVEIGIVAQNPLGLCRDGPCSARVGARSVRSLATPVSKGGAAGDTFIDDSLA